MEKKRKKRTGWIAAVLAGVMALGMAGCASGQSKKDYVTQIDHQLTQEDFLKTEGKLVVNGRGETVYLRGTNIGGYLLQEFWMTPTSVLMEVRDEAGIYRLLEERFGTEKMYQLLTVYQDSYFTETDFDNLDAIGTNCIRLPIWYRNLVDENGEFYENAFERLDWFVEEAGKRGMYVILDMHGAPGSQNGSDHSGVDGESHKEEASEFFWGENAARNQALFYEIWAQIARHYAGNPAVAGYDLLNEPFCTYRYTTERSESELHNLLWNIYDQAYQVIRAEDADHIVILEAVWDPSDLPEPEKMGWENIMYEYHNYLYDDYSNLKGQQIANMEKKLALISLANYDVPSYMGEFSYFDSLEAWDEGLALLNKAGIHWTTWTYKTTVGNGNWGLYHHANDIGKLNLVRSTEEEIIAFWNRVGESTPNQKLLDVVEKYLKE